ncbi:unnamed protein product [Lota lota]
MSLWQLDSDVEYEGRKVPYDRCIGDFILRLTQYRVMDGQLKGDLVDLVKRNPPGKWVMSLRYGFEHPVLNAYTKGGGDVILADT